MRISVVVVATLVAATLAIGMGRAIADGSGDPTAVKDDEGKWLDKNGVPTFHIAKDGTVDWYTFSGFRRYNSSCIVCHGPDGAGSTYAPALVDSLKALDYTQFFTVVVNGKKDVSTVIGQGDAGLGHQSERDVLSRRHLRLLARAFGWRPWAWPSAETRAETEGCG